MKKYLYALNIALLLSACSLSKESSPDNAASESEALNTSGSYWDRIENDTDLKNEMTFVTGLKIILPEKWCGNILTSIASGIEGGDSLVVSEKRNTEAGAGGVLFYLNYIKKPASQTQTYPIFAVETVLGVYKPDDKTEYALILELPREMNYVENNEELKEIYETFSAQVDEVEIITEYMTGFEACSADDLEWIEYFD